MDKNIFKTTRSFRYQWFRVSTHQANANKPFIYSNMKCATCGDHPENASEGTFLMSTVQCYCRQCAAFKEIISEN